MTLDIEDAIKLIVDIMGDQQIQVTIKQAGKGMIIAGACTFVGGLLAGPLGLAVGGAAGGALAAAHTQGTFKSVTQILYELSIEKKLQIVDEIQVILIKLDIKDMAQLGIIYATLTSDSSKGAVVQEFIKLCLPVIQKAIEC